MTSNRVATHHSEARGRPIRLLPIAIAGLGLTALAFTPPGARMARGTYAFLAFYAGVFSLVALSLTVMVGLLATDRLVLAVRHRVLMQSVHRALATAAMVFLVVHIVTKVAAGHAGVLDVVVPFLNHHRTVYIGLGTIAGYLMTAITVSGILRARFAGTSRPWLWRTLHASAYACWPIALLHGLNAGRAAKSWVTVSYVLLVILTGIALLIRLWASWSRHLAAPRTRTSAILRPARIIEPQTLATAYHSASVGTVHDQPAPEPYEGPTPIGRWENTNTDTITDEDFWAYLREELRK
ncbi:MAG TPA: hypothetical protein VGJ28_22965 [Micromonosporaceae bacterium]